MSATKNTVPVISLSEGFGSLVVQGPNIKVEISADGHVNVHSARRVTTSSALASETEAPAAALAIGAKIRDGSIYAGVSPDTGRAMYTTPKDTGLCGEWNKAMAHAARLDAHGHTDWRVPTKAELNALFKNRAAIGNFNETGSLSAGWYWSSSQDNRYDAWSQRFSVGLQRYYLKHHASSLRCVRG